MKRQLFQIMIILSLLFSLSGSIYPVQAASTYPSLDIDQDGISNSLETTGWYNLNGGPYVTNPQKADTDQDGLTDAEEKLYNTNPTDYKSPGISVKYNSAFKTFEYYKTADPAYLHMVQGGNRYLLTEALVVRRGTTFKISAKNTGSANLTISGSGLTTLTPERDPARGGWRVSVPAGGTVGTYNATISDGNGWTKSMPIYVIFELPATTAYLTQNMIDTFLYDDNPAVNRDQVAVWFRVGYFPYYHPSDPADCNSDTPGICSDDQYHLNFGYAQAFWTEQYTKKVLITYTMPAIQGDTTQYAAAQDLSHKADDSVRVNYSAQFNSFSSATNYYYSNTDHKYRMTGGACETNTGVFTSMLRSVGILARPFNLDYNKTAGHGENGNFDTYEYDHAVMMWASNSGPSGFRWFADRTSVQAEAEAQDSPIWHGGTTGTTPLDQVGAYNPANPAAGFGKFRDLYADLIQTVNEGWDYQNGSLGGGMVNTVWPIPGAEYDNPAAPDRFLNRDYKWDSIRPLEMVYQSPYLDILSCQLWNGDEWAPDEWQEPPVSNPDGRDERMTYYLPAGIPNPSTSLENWPYNPHPTACSPSSTDDAACTPEFRAGSNVCTPLPGQTFGLMQAPEIQLAKPEMPALNSTIQLMSIAGDAGLDQDGDGRFDKLAVELELNSTVTGDYQLGGWLKVGEETLRADTSLVTLTSGLQTVQVIFDGQFIGDSQVNGPYQVLAIWAAPADQAVSDLALPEEMAAYQTYEYATQAYAANEFIVKAATIADNFAHSSVDEDGNGAIDAVTISVPLDIAIPGTFTVEGDLYDSQDQFVGHAEWTGSGPTALLTYEVKQTVPPYSLEHLNLTDSNGKLLDARFAPAYKVEDLGGSVDQGNIFPVGGSSQSPSAITPTNTFSANLVDTNSNGKYDQLVIDTHVDVTGSGGTYRIEGLLVDDRGVPAAWSVSDPQTLTVGTNRILQMAFNTRMLFDLLPVSGSQKFNLVAVKIFSGSPGSYVLEAEVPITNFSTPTYSRSGSSFERSSPNIIFQDDIESGAGKWSSSGGWSIVNTAWHSYSQTWALDGSGTLSVSSPINLTSYAHPVLTFFAAYEITGSATAMLEVSDDNGTTWDILRTYTAGSTDYWTREMVDLGAYASKSNVRFRFRGQSQAQSTLTWYVDDVFLVTGIGDLYLPLVVKD